MSMVEKRTIVAMMALGAALSVAGCARQPYETKKIYEGQRAAIALQHETGGQRYSHPVQLRAEEIASILRGFSIRQEQRLPLRWFAEERSPDQLFHEEEIAALTPFLAEGLQKAGEDERVHFALFAPGKNRADSRTVTAGWIGVRDARFYLTIEYLHAEVPLYSVDHYVPNHPNLPPLPGSYLLFFEPGRFWVTDQAGSRALEYREFLHTAPLVNPKPASPQS